MVRAHASHESRVTGYGVNTTKGNGKYDYLIVPINHFRISRAITPTEISESNFGNTVKHSGHGEFFFVLQIRGYRRSNTYRPSYFFGAKKPPHCLLYVRVIDISTAAVRFTGSRYRSICRCQFITFRK
ncbi:hypothetical protein J6590_076331 [Homalodisca vitripennis]|nr:hypothetical protein J6590_076331 [Homalodisca vitripennis]